MHSLRRATLDDVHFLTEVVIAATRAQDRLSPDFDEEDYRGGFAEWTAEQISEGGDSQSALSVIEVDGRAVGRLRVVRTPSVIELAGIQLAPDAQSQGVGSAVVTALIDEAAATSRALTLSVELDNPRARDFYARLGFVETGRTEEEVSMVYDPARSY